MRQISGILLILFFVFPALFGQKYFSKAGRIHFLSEAPIERIEASNSNAYVVFDAATSQIEWSVLIKGFKFEKALMQEHFNENYMESSKFPKAMYKGSISNMTDIRLDKDGEYKINATGNLTIHGVTKPFNLPAKISVKGGKVSANSTFDVVVEDFNIKVPKIVRENIARVVQVTVTTDFQKMN